jgi:hypothetical protein
VKETIKGWAKKVWAWFGTLQCLLVVILTDTIPGIFGVQVTKWDSFWISSVVIYFLYLDYKYRNNPEA